MTDLATRPRVAILGVGHVGSALARVMLDAGYDVSVAASGDPAKIALIASVLMPGAKPSGRGMRWPTPTSSFWRSRCTVSPSLDHGMLDGKIVSTR